MPWWAILWLPLDLAYFFIAAMFYCIIGIDCLLLMLPFSISYALSWSCIFVTQNIKWHEKTNHKAKLCVFNVAISVTVILLLSGYYLFVKWLLSGKRDCSDTTSKCTRLKQSFGQDMIYAVSNGKIKTPKSILFSQAVKTLTNTNY